MPLAEYDSPETPEHSVQVTVAGYMNGMGQHKPPCVAAGVPKSQR